MSTCKDCKHWDQNYEHFMSADSSGVHACRLTTVHDGHLPLDKLAYAYDTEGHFSTLLTKPDFGCNQFEAKQ